MNAVVYHHIIPRYMVASYHITHLLDVWMGVGQFIALHYLSC